MPALTKAAGAGLVAEDQPGRQPPLEHPASGIIGLFDELKIPPSSQPCAVCQAAVPRSVRISTPFEVTSGKAMSLRYAIGGLCGGLAIGTLVAVWCGQTDAPSGDARKDSPDSCMRCDGLVGVTTAAKAGSACADSSLRRQQRNWPTEAQGGDGKAKARTTAGGIASELRPEDPLYESPYAPRPAPAGTPAASDPARDLADSAGGRPGALTSAPSDEPQPDTGEIGSEPRPPTDPDRLLLWQLGVDLDHPEAEMRRLAAEYRGGLLLGGSLPPDRMLQLDHGMIALLHVCPSCTGTVRDLMIEDELRLPQRYFSLLLRHGERETVESDLVGLAQWGDPVHRGSALLALGPVVTTSGLQSLFLGFRDHETEVRQVAAAVAAESAATHPAIGARTDFRDAVSSALIRERDPVTRISLLYAWVGPTGLADAESAAFLAQLPAAADNAAFHLAWQQALGRD